ncbi:MAG TPA: hypothetical protein VD788_11080 [Candidatus Polarisedimenticolaceae bacterium]|nr:hypothetical protein [Candidatus Polarisedimenticolaceae bacterium]
MFWNEPSLYGASFPYRDVTTPVQHPLMGVTGLPWQQFPRFVPPIYGFNQPFFNMPIGNTPMVNPMIYPQFANPFLRPFDVPQMRFDVPRWDLPLHNLYRPFF